LKRRRGSGTDEATFAAALRRANHTLKRALTDPAIVAGIGNAYSDEILHRARLSPVALTRSLGDAEVTRLFAACRTVLSEWTERLRTDAGDGFPDHVTAFRDGMAVHGRHGQPCPDCGAPVQRIVFADREVNYCARCQTGGRCSPTAPCRGCSGPTGRAPSRSSKSGERGTDRATLRTAGP
jgi:formamidopyrimidine-DNA glycosylase